MFPLLEQLEAPTDLMAGKHRLLTSGLVSLSSVKLLHLLFYVESTYREILICFSLYLLLSLLLQSRYLFNPLFALKDTDNNWFVVAS